ncbi:MAG TPA: hypothetical protein VNO30_48255 [Kofleriaceae bacterium]|nr:hypothetical protein [Kofleriaceae bacterium]
MSRRTPGLAALLLAASAPAAFAESIDTDVERSIEGRDVAADHAFTPGIARATGAGRAVVTAATTLNGASDQVTLDMIGDIRIFGPVRLVLQVTNVFETARPGIGAAIQFLDEQRHGVAASGYLSYKAEGFTEPEGEIEALLSFGKQLGPLRGTLNLAYGQDPEARERDGEAAAALHLEPVRGLFAGVVGRYRDALGSGGENGVIRDVLAGASATYTLGKFGVTAIGGFSGVETTGGGSMQAGPAGVLSLGAVF